MSEREVRAEIVPAEPESFYAEALTAAERLRVPRARGDQSVDDEIALLRLRLLRYMRDNPEDMAFVLRSVRMVVQTAAVRYRLSPKASDDLAQSIAEVVNRIGGALGIGATRAG